jgi:hypothetical protein
MGVVRVQADGVKFAGRPKSDLATLLGLGGVEGIVGVVVVVGMTD